MMRRLSLLALLCGMAALCNSTTITVHAYNFNFTTDGTHQQILPAVLRVGDTVHWVVDEGFHCTKACAGMKETWSSPQITVGQSFDHTFTHTGVFGYYCCIHGFDAGGGVGGGMSGKVYVFPAFVKPTPIGLVPGAPPQDICSRILDRGSRDLVFEARPSEARGDVLAYLADPYSY